MATPQFQELVRRAFAQQLSGKDADPRNLKNTEKPGIWMLAVGSALLLVPLAFFCAGVITIPAGAILIGYYFLQRKISQRHEAVVQAVMHGRFRLGWPLMINSAFLNSGAKFGAGLLMAAGDEGPEPPESLFHDLADRVEFATPDAPDPDTKILAALMQDEKFSLNRRRRFPPALTAGRAIYAFDIPLERAHFDADLKSLPWIPLLVEPGESGHICVVPFAVITQAMDEARRLGIAPPAGDAPAGPLDLSKPDEAMFAAVLSRNDQALATAIDAGGDVNARLEGIPLLHIVLQKGTDAAVDLILDRDADANPPSVGPMAMSPLHLAAIYNRLPAARRLLEMGAQVDATFGDPPDTPLAIAVRKGHHDMARLLLEAGANPNCDVSTPDTPAQDQGRHALAFAACKGDTEMMKILLDRGANVNHWPQTTISPLMDAAFCGQLEAVKLLVDRGAMIELSSMKLDPRGVSAVHMAAVRGHKDVFDFLVSRSKTFQGMKMEDFTRKA